MAELQRGFGNFTLRGQVVWKDRNNAYDEDTSPNGFLYRRIRFGVKTADKNIVQVELFQTKFDEVTIQNIETKARDKRVKYGEHYDLPEGYRLFMPINLGIEKDADGENIKKQLIPFDAIKYINDTLQNGDTVFMFGSPRFSEFEKDGNKTPQVVFEPRGIYLGTIPYGEEGFEGQSTFDQEIILNSTEKKGDKLIVRAFIVTDKDGNFVPHNFYIDINKYNKFAQNIHKLKFGTVLKAEGNIRHTVKEKEIQVDDGWGESPVKNTVENVIKELEITKVEKPKKEDIGKFTKEDFVKKLKESKQTEKTDDNPFKDDVNDDEWGSNESTSDDPFAEEFDPFA